MANPSKRMQLEYQDMLSNSEEEKKLIRFELINEQLTHLRGYLSGPPDTVYAGGWFTLDIVIGPDYPFTPPKVTFVTKIWHPNVSSASGYICLDILKNK